MEKNTVDTIEYLGTLNAHGVHQNSVTSIMDCVLHYGHTIIKPIRTIDEQVLLSAKQKEAVNRVIKKQIEESKSLIINNFKHLPIVACSYNVGFDMHGNTVLLLARKDLSKLTRDFTPADIDQIKRYHPENGLIQHGIDGLIEGVDKKYALEHMSKKDREMVERIEKEGTMERICKLIGGKDDVINEKGLVDKKFTADYLLKRVGNRNVHDEILYKETIEETGREKIENSTPFAHIREIKNNFWKDALIYVSKLGGNKGPKKFSLSEIKQDLVEIYLPTHLARAIAHETFQAKVREGVHESHKQKMSSCARTLLTMGYVRDNEIRLKKLIS